MNGDAQNLNAAALPENSEPRAESRWFPVWLLVLSAVVAWGAYQSQFVDKTGDYEPNVYYPYHSTNELALLNPKPTGIDPAIGKEVFRKNCMVCHQQNGMGLPNQFPQLAGSEWVNAAGPNRIIRVVLYGFKGPVTVAGKQFGGPGAAPMVAWSATLKDDDIAAVLSYIRQEWGNKADPVTPEQVAAIRAKYPGRKAIDNCTADELMRVPESD